MKIHDLKPPDGAHRDRRRVGRGLGSGRGKTSGKGVKGQKARAGGGVPPYFEGGQLPLVRKLPYRRGFTNPFRVEYEVVNLDQLEALTDTTVTPEVLRAAGLIGKGRAPVKVLGRGGVTKKLTVHAHRFSASARDAITAAGGSIVQIGPPPAPKRERKVGAPKARPEAGEPEAAEPEAVEPKAEPEAVAPNAEAVEAAPAEEVRPAPRRRRAAASAAEEAAPAAAEPASEEAPAAEATPAEEQPKADETPNA